MDIEATIREIEGAVEAQLRLTGDDPVVAEAAEGLMAALEPAVRQAVARLAEQAAAEVSAQLPDHSVDVVIVEGEPSLVVRTVSETVTVSTDDLEARLTVRLPTELKQHLELAAGELGDSVNTYVVKTLTTKTKAKGASTRFRGTINT
jgi:molybdopterin-guanine dinucleotide biosynthesis protein